MTLREGPATENSDLHATSISNADPPLQQRLGVVAHGCCRAVVRALESADMSLYRYRVMTPSRGGCMIGPVSGAAEARLLILHINHHISFNTRTGERDMVAQGGLGLGQPHARYATRPSCFNMGGNSP